MVQPQEYFYFVTLLAVHLTIMCHPFDLPRKFTSVIVYITPQADTSMALTKLHVLKIYLNKLDAVFIMTLDLIKPFSDRSCLNSISIFPVQLEMHFKTHSIMFIGVCSSNFNKFEDIAVSIVSMLAENTTHSHYKDFPKPETVGG